MLYMSASHLSVYSEWFIEEVCLFVCQLCVVMSSCHVTRQITSTREIVFPVRGMMCTHGQEYYIQHIYKQSH